MVKTTVENAVIVHRILLKAKFAKMKDGDQFNILRIRRQIKKVAEDYDDFLKDVREKLQPEGYNLLQTKENPTPEERTTILEVERKVNSCMEPELKKEIELDFTPVSEECMKGFIESNDFTIGEIGEVFDLIGQ